jgi:hypothetical protein
MTTSTHHKNLPFPSFPKRGKSPQQKIPPLKKGDKGGFGLDFNYWHVSVF